jgi:hypothetical protein
VLRLSLFAICLFAMSVQSNAGRDDYLLKIAKGVPESEVSLIVDGLNRANAHLESEYGGSIPAAMLKKIRIRIEASGKGSEESGGAPAAMNWSKGLPKLYFDVKHREWNQGDQEHGWSESDKKLKVGIHEYVHAWQGTLTKKGLSGVRWIDEGIAEFIAFDTMVAAGLMEQSDVDHYLIVTAKNSDGLSRPLKSYSSIRDVWPGEVGAIAIDWLVSESTEGRKSTRKFAEQLGQGKKMSVAFNSSFGMKLEKFYEHFELYRVLLNKLPPEKARSLRPKINY